jgi:hypothetical protein
MTGLSFRHKPKGFGQKVVRSIEDGHRYIKYYAKAKMTTTFVI